MQNFKKIIQKQKKKPVRLTHTEIKNKHSQFKKNDIYKCNIYLSKR